MAIRIITTRFVLRPLTEDDVSERYLSWFSNEESVQFIESAALTRKLDDLRRYVRERSNRENVLFLGIFSQADGRHIGNIKYEPIDPVAKCAVMGILIGDTAFRGRGVTPEVLMASAQWLKAHHGIEKIVLGVDEKNIPAIRAYEKVGFLPDVNAVLRVKPGIRQMVWGLD